MLKVSGFYDSSCTNGDGWRSVIFFTGCPHKCKGCLNPETWDFDGGEFYSPLDLLQKIKNNIDHIDGVTFSGGEPFQERYVDDLLILINEIKKLNLNIWCYTGYLYEELLKNSKYSSILKNIDVLVDGPFIREKYDPQLKFRGSSNQRVLFLNKKT
ncbi:MAG: anaerobic ribonucleoside-triphosphate reductase activating protein [Spirochaetales bacterium]|nr:anaerobic ribonucleoside-triphosphate reductase activating protein [Spirochaetales bacterium]